MTCLYLCCMNSLCKNPRLLFFSKVCWPCELRYSWKPNRIDVCLCNFRMQPLEDARLHKRAEMHNTHVPALLRPQLRKFYETRSFSSCRGSCLRMKCEEVFNSDSDTWLIKIFCLSYYQCFLSAQQAADEQSLVLLSQYPTSCNSGLRSLSPAVTSPIATAWDAMVLKSSMPLHGGGLGPYKQKRAIQELLQRTFCGSELPHTADAFDLVYQMHLIWNKAHT